MSDVRLDGAQQQRAVRVASSAVHRAGCVDFNRVAQLGACRVRFEIVHIRPGEARPSKRRIHHTLLCRAVRDGQSCARPVLVNGGTLDDTPDTVAGRLRLAQPLQNDYSTALAAHIAVR